VPYTDDMTNHNEREIMNTKQVTVSYRAAYGIGQTVLAEFFAKETQPHVIEEGLGIWNRLVNAVNKEDDLLANLFLDDLINYCK
jgi:hypothetical protein